MSMKGRFGFRSTNFEYDQEQDKAAAQEVPKGRPGPMAAAARDAGEANRASGGNMRLDQLETLELAVEMKTLRAADLDLRLVDPEEIDEGHLTRDRRDIDRQALEELKQSIKAKGLGSPIRLDLLPDGRFGLNQGRRRLLAFRELYAETGEDRFARIPALVDRESERESAYRRMVDENLIREDVSFAELAMLAIAYGEEAGLSRKEAVERLFQSADRNKQWTIAGFVRIMEMLGDSLKHPRSLSRDFGRDLVRKLEADGFVEQAKRALEAVPERDSDQELRILLDCMREKARSAGRTAAPRKFRIVTSAPNKRRFDVSVSDKKIVISGQSLGGAAEQAIREFVEKLAQR